MLWLWVFIFRGDHKLELPEARCQLLSRPAGELEGMVFCDRAIQKICNIPPSTDLSWI